MTLNEVILYMEKEDTSAVVGIISRAMNREEGVCARKTIEQHHLLKYHGEEEGRSYYVVKVNGKVIGITGLHKELWVAGDSVCMGWFALDPEYQRRGIGSRMMERTIWIAREKGFKRLFVETYTGDDFESARNFYEKFGFEKAGEIKDYVREGVNKIMYSKLL